MLVGEGLIGDNDRMDEVFEMLDRRARRALARAALPRSPFSLPQALPGCALSYFDTKNPTIAHWETPRSSHNISKEENEEGTARNHHGPGGEHEE
jgi:hypothetical protein